MHALLLQFADPCRGDPSPVFSQSLGVVAELARRAGLSCGLLTLPGFREERIAAAIREAPPDAVLVELDPLQVAAGRRTIAAIAERTDAPIAVVGRFATAKPSRAVSFPGVRSLILGEYDRAAVRWLEAQRDGRDPVDIPGVWTYTDGGLVKSGPDPLPADVDGLPSAERELFGYGDAVKATRELCVKACRGCPLWCAYCINDWYMDLYAEDPVAFVRRRSVGNVLGEIEALTRAYPDAACVTFYDHAFAMDPAWLAEFCAEYPRACKLPFRCHVRLEKVTPEVARMLADGRCRWVHTHIGSGSRFIREEILSMHLSDADVVEAIRQLRAAGLRVAAEVFVGAPYESEITVEETLGLLREARVDEVHPRVYCPTPGTRAAELCRENGWLSGRTESDAFRGRSLLDMPSMTAQQISAVVEKFPWLLKRRRAEALRKLLGRSARTRSG